MEEIRAFEGQHCCGRCRHFQNDPAAIEAAFRGLTAMGSGAASVRSHDGLCHRHDLYLSFHDICDDFHVLDRNLASTRAG